MSGGHLSQIEDAPRSRFAGFKPWPARLVILLLAALMALGLSGSPAPVPANIGNPAEDRADVHLYQNIVEGVRAGGDYHQVAAEAQRAGNYPLKPFVTMRPPTLAWLQAALGSRQAAEIPLFLLLAATLIAWVKRLADDGFSRAQCLIGGLLVATGLVVFRLPELLYWHEAWAAALIALSLALNTKRSYVWSVLVGLAAVMIREIAILYPLVMLAAALWKGRRGEAGAWAGAILILAAFIAWHAFRVAAVTLPGDLASPGWTSAGGWSFVVTMVQLTGPMRSLPYWASAVLLPLALLGWAGWRTAAGLQGALTILAYVMLFACFGRVDNFYWAFLIAPLIPLGLLFVPRAVVELLHAARPREAALST